MSDLTLMEALELINAQVINQTFSPEEISFADSAGRLLAVDLHWDRDHPPYNRAAMDGYAFPGQPEPKSVWPIIGLSRAGEPFPDHVPPFKCIKIATGAVVPDSCDTVIPWEKTEVCDSSVTVVNQVQSGANIHRKGSDRKRGQVALPKGTKLTAAHIAILSTIGAVTVKVQPRVRVSLLSTGSEIVPIEATPRPDQIRASNFYTLKSLLDRHPGVSLKHADFLEDDFQTLLSWFKTSEPDTDCFIVTGGVGTSEFDFVPRLSSEMGYKTILHGLAIKPGHPLFLARKGNRFILGLPGNPVSSTACYSMFAQRLFSHFLNLPMMSFDLFEAGDDLMNKGKRLLMRPVYTVGKRIYPVEWNGSGDITALAKVDGFALIEPKSTIKTGCDARFFALEAS